MRVAQQAVARQRWFSMLMGFILMACTFLVHAKPSEGLSSLATVVVNEMPREAQDTYQAIQKGGPFPYEKDGTVFGNRERLLPRHERGYYREYTVETPGSPDRGARRIVTGGSPPEVYYYTDDHYRSFRRVEIGP